MGIHGHWSDFYSPDELGIEPEENQEYTKEDKVRGEAWERIAAYIKRKGYDWTYKEVDRFEHDYLAYYLNGDCCNDTFMDIIKNNENDCKIAFI